MQLEYIRNTPQVRDVLLSGGDPLVLAPKILDEILTRLREIPHVEIVRIGSRVPVFLPCASPTSCATCCRSTTPVAEHPRQPPQRDQPRAAQATDKLTRAGIPLGNQAVLLAA